MVNYFKKNYYKGFSDNIKIVNGNRRGFVIFLIDYDIKLEVCVDFFVLEGFLDKYFFYCWVVIYMCFLMFVVLLMF